MLYQGIFSMLSVTFVHVGNARRQVEDEKDSLEEWRVAVNVLNKQ
jgi:hypothetical protein